MAFTVHGHHIPGTVLGDERPKSVKRCGGVHHCKQCKDEVESYNEEHKSAESKHFEEQVDWDIDANRPAKSYPAEIIEAESELEKDLGHLLNYHSAENESGTPDFILAMFLKAQLDLFNQTIKNRAVWRGESVELPALLELRRDSKMMDRVIAFLRRQVEEGVIHIKEPLEATDLYRELQDYQPPEDFEQGGLEAGDTQAPVVGVDLGTWEPQEDIVVAPGALDANDGKEVPLVVYTDGQRNEIGTAKLHVTPGEVRVTGTINGAVPMFEEMLTDPNASFSIGEPPSTGRFERYQKKGLSDNGK